MSILAPDRAAVPAAADEEWSLDAARLLYRIDDWGKGYFGVTVSQPAAARVILAR